MVTYFAAPRSYTAEDVVEISCHGSPVVLRFCVERACAAGARLAEPGEFTLRAYLNGRIDLPQAEAVRDLIEATTLYQARVAAQQVEGSVSRRIRPVKEQLLELIALLEAGIDFAEDDISVAPARGDPAASEPDRAGARGAGRNLRLRQAGAFRDHAGHRRDGRMSARAACSTGCWNRIARLSPTSPAPRAIWFRKSRPFDGIPVKFVDTAGIRAGQDLVETLGIERSYQAMADADVTLVVLDLAAPVHADDLALHASARQRQGRWILVGQ